MSSLSCDSGVSTSSPAGSFSRGKRGNMHTLDRSHHSLSEFYQKSGCFGSFGLVNHLHASTVIGSPVWGATLSGNLSAPHCFLPSPSINIVCTHYKRSPA
jgi:hypothetical protein